MSNRERSRKHSRSRSRSRSRERNQNQHNNGAHNRPHSNSYYPNSYCHNSYHSTHNSYNRIRRYGDLFNTRYRNNQFPTSFHANHLFHDTLSPITNIYTLPPRTAYPIIVPSAIPPPDRNTIKQLRDDDIFCSGCGRHQPPVKFSKNQKGKEENIRRCKVCIVDNKPRGAFTKNDRDQIIKTATEDTNNNNNNQEASATITNLNQQLIIDSNNNNNVNNTNNNDEIDASTSENNNDEADFGCVWCAQTFTSVTSLTVHCNTVHFSDSNELQNANSNNNNRELIEIEDSENNIDVPKTFEEQISKVDSEIGIKKAKEKEMELLPIDGRWIVYYSDKDAESDNEYNKLIKHRYKMDLETLKLNEESNGNGKEEADDDGMIVYGHCVGGSGEFEWRFLLKGKLDDNNMFTFSMKGRSETIYGKARFDGRDSLKRGAWYLQQNMKKECGILRAERDVEYDPMKQKDDKEKVMCVICMDNEVNVACIPCGHMSVCRECTDDVKNSEKCPYCAGAITGVMNIYISGF